ncbi:MAG TPA: TonB-dependent receptor [Vicinamibacterales bacterium]|nr:TonB-dependent receptor [Vicinamibacterales bacterium]
MRRIVCFAIAIVSLSAASAFAQGQQYGSATGRVTSQGNAPLPGVTVTASSEALQGSRTATTDVNGVYSLPGLAPGHYLVKFALDGMSSVERRATVSLGTVSIVDQQLAVVPVKESIDVRASTPSPVTSRGASNLEMSDLSKLPVGRTPFLMTELTPGVTDNTPSNSQISISGAFAYDNVFLMDGVDINDNVLGTANNLFIEEAIQETQVLSSAVSAEYGRFSGGVVNIITRSGGNALSGAFRVNLTNPAWSAETPFEKAAAISRARKYSPTYEATVGGPLRRDRVWFFGGARLERTTTQSAFAQTRIPYTTNNDNTRYEGKVTATVHPGHTLQGTLIDNQTDLRQPSLGSSIDPATMTTPSTPNRIAAATWRGMLRRVFVEAQFSQKNWKLENAGGTSAAIVDSPFLTRGVSGMSANLQYNGPYFDSTDPEERNNQQFTTNASETFASRRLGTHELKTGFESFTSTRVGGNSQSLSGYVFQTDYKVASDGRPELDANGRLIPRFVPGMSRLQTWMPLRGSSIDLTTVSAYVNDRWTAGSRFTFDLGVRYERARSTATGNISGADGSAVVPRLGAAYDLTADGRTVVHATYGHYAGKYNDVQFSRNSNVGNADRITGNYIGPAGEGRDFTAGFDPANYQTFTGTFPTANVFFEDGLESPLTREFTLGFARELRNRGWARATYVERHATNFVEDFITMAEGQTIVSKNGVNLGAFDNAVYRNTTLPTRDYQALQFESAYRPTVNLSVNGHWTVQLQNDGTFEGESSSGPAVPSLIADYPEIYVPARHFPAGRLDDFQRNKIRVWATYQLALGRFGAIDVAPLYRYNSGRTYSLVASGVPLSAQQIARNPGYARLPASQSIFFGDRGSQSFEGFHLVDLAATYSVPVWQSLRPWVKLEILNTLNNQTLVSWNTSVTADTSGPKDENGLPITYTKSAAFGTATGPASYPRPRPGMDGGRTFLVAGGVRF